MIVGTAGRSSIGMVGSRKRERPQATPATGPSDWTVGLGWEAGGQRGEPHDRHSELALFLDHRRHGKREGMI